MIEAQSYRTIPTYLDLNGPVLTFSENPTNLSSVSGIATFVGVATVFFPDQTPTNPAELDGTIAYQWYEVGVGALSDGDNITGTATTTLTLTNLSSPGDNNRQFYLKSDYVPSGNDGNAINDGLDSSIVILTVPPIIVINQQPISQTIGSGSEVTFSVDATLTDTTGEISYQWILNGEDIDDTETSLIPQLTVTDELGNTTSVADSYSGFVSGTEYTVTSNVNTETRLYAVGGGGGTETARGSSGGSGGSTQGDFTFLAGQTYKLRVGGGAQNATAGYNGGGSGGSGGAGGVAGGGGGYTGFFVNSVSHSNSILIAGGGGGGGNDPAAGGSGGGLTGGNSGNAGGRGGFGASQTSGGVGASSGGSPGSALQGAPGGAGAGGGGYYGGGSGARFSGCCADGGGGGGSGYLHPSLITNGSFSGDNTAGGGAPGQNGSFKVDILNAQSYSYIGTKTKDLKITLGYLSTSTLQVRLTSDVATNSPLLSNEVQLNIVTPRPILRFESYDSTSTASLSTINLDDGDYTLNSSVFNSDNICFYSPEKSFTLEIDLYGAKGSDSGSFSGGQGGFSQIRFNIEKNTEYILKGIGSSSAIFLYRKGQLMCVVGQGGNAGATGAGGAGGGVNVAGAPGTGNNFGNGGQLILVGSLTNNGIFGSSSNATTIYQEDSKATGNNGGITISCSKGVYWRNQGYSSCEDVGNTQFRLSDGTLVSNSFELQRGFKIGYAINQTGGQFANTGGRGGNGATGGQGGLSGGGGGGSGYSDGSVTIVNTQLGGSTGNPYAIFRVV